MHATIGKHAFEVDPETLEVLSPLPTLDELGYLDKKQATFAGHDVGSTALLLVDTPVKVGDYMVDGLFINGESGVGYLVDFANSLVVD